MDTSSEHNYCIIMAGGIGSRFWPMSRNARPKQFLDILGVGKTFLQLTYARFLKIIPADRIYIVASAAFKDLVLEQLPDLDPDLLLLEPARRNTAPCIAYASYKLLVRDPQATVLVAPSDHLILDDDIFYSTIEAAMTFARQKEVLITLGIKPTRPETGYGYIQAKKSQGEMINGHLGYPVKTFTEKPSAEMAQILIDSGEFYWNSGIFIWSIQAIINQMRLLIPEISRLFEDGIHHYSTPTEIVYIQKIYESCRNISIDYAVMEKASNCYVFSANFGWSDMGSWETYYLHMPKDNQHNAVVADRTLLDKVSNSLVVSKIDQKLTVIKGLDQFMIVDTPEILLVCPREAADFKQILNLINFDYSDFS